MTPKRIQLQRVKGWRKPDNTVVISRPTKWGNPFKVGEWISCTCPLFKYAQRALPLEGCARQLIFAYIEITDNRMAVDAYTWWLIEQPYLMLELPHLTGKNLACWCPLDQPCHADILLELANPHG